ncbi:MAG: DUF4340 domain-containing protein [Nitrospirae bacterium]|nr:DUF4340 domain-containing protein [Nitrospirota bacterium]
MLLLWVGVLLGLVAYLRLVDLPRERTTGDAPGQADLLLAFDPTAATALELKTSDTTIALTKDQAGAWQILSPVATVADQEAVRSLLLQVTRARRLRVIEDNPTALGPYGLDPAPVILKITIGGGERRLDVGDKSPVGSSVYVRVWPAAEAGREGPVWLAPIEVREAATKTLYDLRKKELFDMAAGSVTALELRYPGQSPPVIRLERHAAAGKTAGPITGWSLVTPVRAAADDQAVDALLKQISSLRASAILDTGKAEKLAGFKRPKVEIVMRGGEHSTSVRLFFPLSEEAAYAVTTPEAPLYQVDRQTVLQFERTVFDLQDKRVAQIRPEGVQRLVVEQPAGRYQLVKGGGEAWMSNGQPLSKEAEESLQKFLKELWLAKVEKIAGSTASAWPKLGLTTGAIVITLFSGDNSTIQPVVVRLGKKEGELLYIRRGDEIESYITPSPLRDLLPDMKYFTN